MVTCQSFTAGTCLAFTRAGVLYEQGKLPAAIDAFWHTVRLDPLLVEVRDHRMCAVVFVRDKDELLPYPGIEHKKHTVRLDPLLVEVRDQNLFCPKTACSRTHTSTPCLAPCTHNPPHMTAHGHRRLLAHSQALDLSAP